MILPLLAQTARALQVVHEAGVVHRDVKPSNILVNQEGLAKLLDFGISSGANQLPMTATGMVMGTPEYLAPDAGYRRCCHSRWRPVLAGCYRL